MELRNVFYFAGLILAFVPPFSYAYLSRSSIGESPLLPQILSIGIFCIGLSLILIAERWQGKS